MKPTRLFISMLACAALFAGCSDGDPASYTITVSPGAGGTASASAPTATAGTRVYLYATPDPGYNFYGYTVTSNNTTVTGGASPSFVMPEGDVTIDAAFALSDISTLRPGAFTGLTDQELADSMKCHVDFNSQWMTGSNGYGDTSFGQLFKGTAGGTVDKVTVYLKNGYQGDVDNVAVSIYSISNDLPATLLATSTEISTEDIPDVITPVEFTFDTPVTVPSDFAVTINVPVYGETSTDIVVASSPGSTSLTGTELYPVSYNKTSGWENMISAWGIANLFDLAIFPVLTRL